MRINFFITLMKMKTFQWLMKVKLLKKMERGINLLNTEENSGIVLGRNPVMEALKNDREIEKIQIAKGTEGSILKIVGMAKDKKIPVMYGDKAALDRVANGVPHQGVIAYTSSFKYCEVEEILALAKTREEDPFIIILDNIEDPHNLGAIMRSAEVTGVHGLIISKRRAVGVTDVVTRASAGAVEYMACAKVANCLLYTSDAADEEDSVDL